MSNKRVSVLSIAGFDPSGGAGVLADVKTFEQFELTGMASISALTVQNDCEFSSVKWLSFSEIIAQVKVLQKRFKFDYVKIGLIENFDTLSQIVQYLYPTSKIIWDPILKASAGFNFHSKIDAEVLTEILKKIYLITPNIPEAIALGESNDATKNAIALSNYCNVYLKGGHHESKIGEDILFTFSGERFVLTNSTTVTMTEKHGSGCVLSSALTANLAKGLSLEKASKKTKEYISAFLSSNDSLLGTHANIHTDA